LLVNGTIRVQQIVNIKTALQVNQFTGERALNRITFNGQHREFGRPNLAQMIRIRIA
jgi:hypothetical protein